MTAERISAKGMIAAELARERLVEVIREGKVGGRVSLNLEIAALVFRIDKKTLRRMGEKDERLGVSVKAERVLIELQGGEGEQRQAYKFFYGLLQAVKQGAGESYLETPVPSSLKEIPGIEETLAVLESGNDLPDEEMLRLQIYLLGNWLALKDKSDLPPPEVVFSSLG